MTALEVLEGLERQAADRGGALALQETTGRRLSFAQLQARIETLASALLDEGMRPGDRVLFTVPPGIESIVSILAIVRAGGVVVAANPLMGPEIFAGRVRLIEPGWVIATSLVYLLGRLSRLPNLMSVPARHFITVGVPLPFGRPMMAMRALSRKRRSVRPVVSREPDDPVLIVFTSGTTAAPRAVVQTNGSIGAAIDMMSREERFDPGDVLYSDQLHLVLPALLAGVPAVIPRRRFNPARLLADLRRYRATQTFGFPSEYQQLVEYTAARGRTLPASLRTILLGSAPVPRTFLERLQAVLPATTRVRCVYGMTEIVPVSRVDLEEKLVFHGEGDLVGRPVEGVRVRIAGDGELLVSGPNLCRGYWGQPPVTEVATGDLGVLDGDGRIVLFGRKKEMIIRGQHNIYPEVLESSIGGISGVRRCCLVGLYQDARADEEVILCVEGEPGTDAAALHTLVERSLRTGSHRIDAAALPDRIVIMPIPLAPRSKKVDRSAVRVALQSGG